MDELSRTFFNNLVGQDIKIIGEKKEKYIDDFGTFDGENYEYIDKELEQDTICIESNGKKYELTMRTVYGEPPSFWNVGSWSTIRIRQVADFGELTHEIKNPTTVRINREITKKDVLSEDFSIVCDENNIIVNGASLVKEYPTSCPIFEWVPIGGSSFQPTGYHIAYKDAFIALNQEQEIPENFEQIQNAKVDFSKFMYITKPTEEDYSKGTPLRNQLVMKDGESMSVQATEYHFCSPRVTGLSRYDSYEVDFPSSLFEELEGLGEVPGTNETIFSFVSEDKIAEIIANHGGIDFERSLGSKVCHENGISTNKARTTLAHLNEAVSKAFVRHQ